MNKILFLTGVLCAATVSLNATVTVLFENAADLSNFDVPSGTVSATADVIVVDASSTPVASVFGGDAIRVYDADTGKRPALNYDASNPFGQPVKISFDVNFASGDSNIMFRIGPTASGVGAKGSTSVGVQLASSGTIVAEGTTNTNFASQFSLGTSFNFAIIYNISASPLDLTSEGGPLLAANTWAMFKDGSQIGGTFAETTGGLDPAQGFAFLSGTSATRVMEVQYDNITIETIGVPEPSTYAAILGFLALLYILRTRKRS